MTERRLAPLTALTTLDPPSRRVRRTPTRDPGAPAPPRPAGRGSSTTPSTPRDAGWRRRRPPPRAGTSSAAGEERLAWLGLYRPEPQELGELAELFDLPELAVEDAIKAHQRPKFERYGDTLFVVLKAARYLDEAEEVEFGELHLFLGADFAITVRHSESPDLSRVRRRLESEPALLAKGSEAVLYATLDAVVDGYRPVVDGLATDIDEIETEVFRGDPGVSRRIYELSQEVLEFQRAAAAARPASSPRSPPASTSTASTRSCAATCATSPTTSPRCNERVEGFRQQLRDILTVNATLVAQRQNEEIRELTEASIAQGEEVKKISAWAAILFAPTLVGTVYGMNFDACPSCTGSSATPWPCC